MTTALDLETWSSHLCEAMAEVSTSALMTEWATDGPIVGGFDETDRFGAYIPLVGESNALLGVASTKRDCQTIAKTLLGMEAADEDLPTEDLADALGEVANMVAGVVKTRAIDDDPSLKLGLPTCFEGHFNRMRPTEVRMLSGTVGGTPVVLVALLRSDD